MLYGLVDLSFAGRSTVLYVKRVRDGEEVEVPVAAGMVDRSVAESVWAPGVNLRMKAEETGTALVCGSHTSCIRGEPRWAGCVSARRRYVSAKGSPFAGGQPAVADTQR